MNPESENTSSQLLRLLQDPLQYERPPLLISRLTEILAEMPRMEGVQFFSRELNRSGRSLHFRFVLLQAAVRLAWPELLDSLRAFVLSDGPIQLARSALSAVVATRSVEAYRFCLELMEKCLRPEIAELARGQIAVLLKENRRIHHLHAVLNGLPGHRDPFFGLEELAAALDRESRSLLIPALRKLCGTELAVLSRLAGLCADPVFTGPLLTRLQQDWRQLTDMVHKELLMALCCCAASFAKRERIRLALEKLFPMAVERQREFVLIWSLPLLSEETKADLFARFRTLAPKEKICLMEVISAEDMNRLSPFILEALGWEEDDQLFECYVEWLLERGFVRDCLNRLGGVQGTRLRLLLCGICSRDCQTFVNELLPFFHAGTEDDLLVSLSGALLKGSSTAAAKRAWELMKSGVSLPVQSALIRRLPDWLPLSAVPLEDVFAVCLTMEALQAEWLVSWARLLGLWVDSDTRLRILDGVLVMFEQLADTDPLPYIDFFRRLDLHSSEEFRLVREEVQLILNTLLRSSSRPAAVRMLAELLRELDKREIREKS